MGEGQKTEPPTQKRLNDLRKKGQISKSKDISSTTIVVGMFGILWTMGSYYVITLGNLTLFPIAFFTTPFSHAYDYVLTETAFVFVTLIVPMVLGIAALSVLIDYFQVGSIFTFEPIKPDLNKLNPVNALKNIFSLKNIMELVKNIIKIAFLTVLVGLVLKDVLQTLLYIPYGGIDDLFGVIGVIMKEIIEYTAIGYIVIAAADYFLQKYMFLKKNKMSKEEIKQEYKEMEGDPLIKSKRRQMHQQLINNNMLQRVRKATVVITNPNHLAIALYYDKNGNRLPVIVGKGDGSLAKRIIEVAQEEGIPVMQNVPLAHDLYDNCNINDYIPADLIEPVAEVLRWVYQMASSGE